MPRDRGIARYGSLRCALVRYGCRMEQTCDYCLEKKKDVQVVSYAERNSGPPAVVRACQMCMNINGLVPWLGESV